MMITIHEKVAKIITSEPNFELFKHDGLICCVQRMNWSGNLNGYVAVPETHPFYGKHYGDKIIVKQEPVFNENFIGLLCHGLDGERKEGEYPLDLAINVHHGLTYSSDGLNGIENDLFPKLWWFGFDTAHSGDLKPYQTEIDLMYPHKDDVYRDFKYVKDQTISLAEQLNSYAK